MMPVNKESTPGPADQFRLREDQLPQRLQLELPQEVLDRLQRSAEQSGRCLNELLVELLDRALQQQGP